LPICKVANSLGELLISFIFVFSNKSPANNTRRQIKDTKDAENMDDDCKVAKIIEKKSYLVGE